MLIAWLVLQVLVGIFQVGLLFEVGRHLAALEDLLATHCGPGHQRHGVCLGPSWNMSYYHAIPMNPGTQFTFDTQSDPPTFLIAIEPQPPHNSDAWELSVGGTPGTCIEESTEAAGVQIRRALHFIWYYFLHSLPWRSLWPTERPTSCGQALLAATGPRITVLHGHGLWGAGHWTASFTAGPMVYWLAGSSGMPMADVHVLDSVTSHIGAIRRQRDCNFARSWQNFSQRHNGEHHAVLWFTWHAVALFLCISVALTGIVFWRFYYYVDSCRLLRRVICLKFIAQDLPQQICIVAYLYAWYATNGLRCQMCLFHVEHCEEEHPLHTGNLLLLLFTALSACSNQVLLQGRAGVDNIFDIICLLVVRVMLFSLSVLPLSIAGYLSVLWFPYGQNYVTVVSVCVLAACPMVIGLMTLSIGPFVLLIGLERIDGWIDNLLGL